jgi:sulfate transport system permease protein
VIFISGNKPMVSEILPVLIITKLEEYDYAGATAMAVVMLLMSLAMLLTVNLIQAWRARHAGRGGDHAQAPLDDPTWVRRLLIGAALSFAVLFLAMPLMTVLVEGLRKGVDAYWAALADPDTLAAIRLTLLVAAIAVPLNTIFGIAAAWSVTRFRFRGRQWLITLIDLPFSVSPVVAGLVFVLLFGAQGWLGPWLAERDLKVIFDVPGLVLATVFVTFPFVARGADPLDGIAGDRRRTGGHDARRQRLAGLPACDPSQHQVGAPLRRDPVQRTGDGRVRRGLGRLGHIRGLTNTLPLQVEILHAEYQFAAAFAVASLLALLALVTLALQQAVAWLSRSPR